jgi:hypothetical protein
MFANDPQNPRAILHALRKRKVLGACERELGRIRRSSHDIDLAPWVAAA